MLNFASIHILHVQKYYEILHMLGKYSGDLNNSVSYSNGLVIPLQAKRVEVANLTERKNPHTPVYSVKEFVCVSVCGQLFTGGV